MKALSIRQPWAWAILHAGKDIEDRDWKSSNPGLRFRGVFLIHAAKGGSPADYRDDAEDIARWSGISPPSFEDAERGGIVGIAEVVDVVREHPSRWFFGPVGLVLANARPLPFAALKGHLGFFDVPDSFWQPLQAARSAA